MSEFPYGFLIVQYHLFPSPELTGKCPVLSIEMSAVGSVSGNAGSLTNRVNIEIMPFCRLIMNHISCSGSESMATQTPHWFTLLSRKVVLFARLIFCL